jgi:hypothetical protein
MAKKIKQPLIEVTVKVDGEIVLYTSRGGTVLARIGAMLRRPEGCTRGDLLELTGWDSISVQQQAEQLKLGLVQRSGRYYGRPKK